MLIVWQYSLNNTLGELHPYPLGIPAKKLDEISNQLPGGVYTTFRTYHKIFALNLEDHINRLEHSIAVKIGKVNIDQGIFRRNLRSILQQHPAPECRIRATLVQTETTDTQMYLAVEDLIMQDPILYRIGVHALTTKLSRSNPDVKDTEFIKQTKTLRGLLTNGINEVLMVDHEGEFLEGLSSNFFGVEGDTLITRQQGVLPGITRKLVLQVAASAKIPIRFSGIRLERINSLSEAFITSSSRGVLPVVKVDQVVIGDGHPGKITQLLSDEFARSVEALIKSI